MKKYASRLAGITPRFSAWLAACVAVPCVLLTAPAWSASFDCSQNGSANEKIICSDPELSALDDKLGKTFRQARKKAASRHAFSVASDKQWRWREQNCHDRACLVEWYHRRQTELEAALSAPEDTTAQADTPKTPEPKAAKLVRQQVETSKNKPETANTPVVATDSKTTDQIAARAARFAALTKALEARTAQAPVAPATATMTATPVRSTLQLQLSPSQIASIAPEGVTARAHYVSANKGEYLYADTDVGGDAHGTVSVRYLGTEHGQHIIEVRRKDVYTRYTCSADCALIGKLQLPGDADTDMVILKNDHKSLPSLIVTDALNGLLLESVAVR
jgi:uncharacterized protein